MSGSVLDRWLEQYRIQGDSAFQGQPWRASAQTPEARIKELEASRRSQNPPLPKTTPTPNPSWQDSKTKRSKPATTSPLAKSKPPFKPSSKTIIQSENTRHSGTLPHVDSRKTFVRKIPTTRVSQHEGATSKVPVVIRFTARPHCNRGELKVALQQTKTRCKRLFRGTIEKSDVCLLSPTFGTVKAER